MFRINLFCKIVFSLVYWNFVTPLSLNDTTDLKHRIFGVEHLDQLNNDILQFYYKSNISGSSVFFSNLRSYIFEIFLYINLIENGDEKVTHKAFMLKSNGGPSFFKVATERQNFPKEIGWDESETKLYINLIIDVEQAWNSLSRMLDVIC